VKDRECILFVLNKIVTDRIFSVAETSFALPIDKHGPLSDTEFLPKLFQTVDERNPKTTSLNDDNSKDDHQKGVANSSEIGGNKNLNMFDIQQNKYVDSSEIQHPINGNPSEIQRRNVNSLEFQHLKQVDSSVTPFCNPVEPSKIRQHRDQNSSEIRNSRSNDLPEHENENSSKLQIGKDDSPDDRKDGDDGENEIIDVTGDESPSEKHDVLKKLSSVSSPYLSESSQQTILSTSSLPSCTSPPNTIHTDFHSSNPLSTTPTSLPMVTLVDASKFKWDFPSASYILSSSGNNELKRVSQKSYFTGNANR